MQIQSAGSISSVSSVYADASCSGCSADNIETLPQDSASIAAFSADSDGADLNELYSLKDQAQSELDDLKSQAEEARPQINARRQELIQEQQGGSPDNELQAEYEQAQAEYEEAAAAKTEAQQELTQIQQESSANDRAVSANAQQKQQVSADLGSAQSELASLTPPSPPGGDDPEAEAAYQAELQAYQAKKNALENKINSLQQQLQQLESEAQKLQAEKQQLAQGQQQAQTEISRQDAAMQTAQTKMDEVQQKQTEDNPELQQALEEDGELQALQEEYEQISRQQAEKEAELSQLEVQIADAEAQDKGLQAAEQDGTGSEECFGFGMEPGLNFSEEGFDFDSPAGSPYGNWDDIVRSGANTSSDDYPFEKWDKYIRPDYKEDQSSGENKNNSLSQYQIQLIKERAFDENDPMLPDMLNQMQKEGVNIEDIKIISGTKGSDNIKVYNNDKGEVIVSINGKDTAYSQEEAQKLLIDAGDGDDKVVVDARVTANMHIYGGGGDDYLQGGGGDDVIYGGRGDDTMYGLSGSDSMYGGSGKDYMDGGRGDDNLHGGEGNDNLIGGKGDDKMRGGEGDDLLVGASGSDVAEGQEGSDRVIADSGDTVVSDDDDPEVLQLETAAVPSNYVISGNPSEIERIESDFEFLASTENGQLMFNEIAATGRTVAVQSTYEGSSCNPDKKLSNLFSNKYDSVINYNLTKTKAGGQYSWAKFAPVVGLYHEMCHSYNFAKGNMNNNYYNQATGEKVAGTFTGSGGSVDKKTHGVSGAEFQAVGIPNEHVEANPDLLTENSMRELLDYNRRDRYF